MIKKECFLVKKMGNSHIKIEQIKGSINHKNNISFI
jgi:hypothetical protein